MCHDLFCWICHALVFCLCHAVVLIFSRFLVVIVSPCVLFIVFRSVLLFLLQKCFYCRSTASGKDNNGACVQCCAGKCAVSFHVTCFVLAGFALEPSDWPQPTETFCERHQRTRFKVSFFVVIKLVIDSFQLKKGKVLSSDRFLKFALIFVRRGLSY